MSFTNSASTFFISFGLFSLILSGILPGYLYVLGFVGGVFLIFIGPKYNLKDIACLMFLIFFSVLSIFSTMVYTPILYLLVSVLIFTSLKGYSFLSFSDRYIRFLFFLVLIFFILQYVFLPNSHDDRFRGIYGDPNFVSLWFFSIIYFLYSASLKVKNNYHFPFLFLIVLFSFIIIYLTQSRMAILSVVVFLTLLYFVRVQRIKIVRCVLLFLLLSSIFLQYILYFIFVDYIEVGNAINKNAIDRLSNLNDTSNLSRVVSAYHGVNLFFSQNAFEIAFGMPGLFNDMVSSGYNIPHNWFIQSLFMFGVFFTLLLVFLLMKVIYKSPSEVLPYVGMMLIMSSILSVVVVPLLFFFVSIFLLKKK